MVGAIWTLPNTALGLLLVWLTGCRRHVEPYTRTRFWLAPSSSRPWRWWRRRWGFEALTLGTITICLVWPPGRLLEHEARHQRQARLLGPFYLPAYLLGCLIGWLRGDWYKRNPLEEDAGV